MKTFYSCVYVVIKIICYAFRSILLANAMLLANSPVMALCGWNF